jgi:hypothetical protein
LLTNLPADTPAQALEKLQWDLCRWQIEVDFRILKGGWCIEKLQLENPPAPIAQRDRFTGQGPDQGDTLRWGPGNEVVAFQLRHPAQGCSRLVDLHDGYNPCR